MAQLKRWLRFRGVRCIYRYISIIDITTLFKNIDIDKATLEDIDINIEKAIHKNIDIDKNILENIYIDKGILENINIDIDKDISGKKFHFFSKK